MTGRGGRSGRVDKVAYLNSVILKAHLAMKIFQHFFFFFFFSFSRLSCREHD